MFRIKTDHFKDNQAVAGSPLYGCIVCYNLIENNFIVVW